MYYNYNYVNVDVHADLQTFLVAIVWALCKLVIYYIYCNMHVFQMFSFLRTHIIWASLAERSA
jgi:hypothetical protein